MMPARIRIAAILKKSIYSGEYHSGDELSLTDVDARIGVSRTPVREAFQALEAGGLITLLMNRGAIVNQIDRKFIQDNFEMRILLESEAARRAAERGMETETLLERLYELQAAMPAPDRAAYEALNQDLYMAIWTAADNQRLKTYLLELWNGPSTGHSHEAVLAHYQESTKEHLSLLEAIKDRDAGKAHAMMKKHITRSMHNILQMYPKED